MISSKLISPWPTSSIFHFLLFYSIHFFHSSSCMNSETWEPSPSNFPRSYDPLRESSLNEIPRLPVWNGNGATHGDGQRQIDFTQLFELMGEPRGSRGRELSELITRPRPKCNRRIRIMNGVTRIRERGSLARFQCSHGFTLIGPTTVVCLRDRWSEDPPICVRSGCRPLRKPENGDMRQSIGGAVAAFYCAPNANLIGNAVIFCDGGRWNGTEPICHVDEPSTTTTVSTITFLSDEMEAELEWDTNLDISQSSTDLSSVLNELSGATSENPIITGESSSESNKSFPVHIPASTETTIKEGDFLHGPTVPTTVKVPFQEHSSVKPENAGSINPTPFYEATTVAGIDMGQNDTHFPLLPTFPSTFRSPVNPDRITSAPGPSRSESQQSPVSEAPPSILLVASTSEQILPTTTRTLDIGLGQQPTTFRPPPIVPLLTTRRFKIWTKRPRPSRPLYTRRPGRRPIRRRNMTTTTFKPRITRFPLRKQGKVTVRPRPVIKIPARSPTTPLPSAFLVPGSSQSSPGGESSDYTIAIDKEFLPREHVSPIRPVEIKPDMLNINVSKYMTGSRAEQSHQLAHSSIVGGIIFFVIGLVTFSAGVVLYCWRKNKGIARARPYDMDGRTLSLHDANDDFMWLEQNQRDNSVL